MFENKYYKRAYITIHAATETFNEFLFHNIGIITCLSELIKTFLLTQLISFHKTKAIFFSLYQKRVL